MALTRSEIMSRIRSTETGPERAVRSALWAAGVRGWRKNYRVRYGPQQPAQSVVADVAFPSRRLAVFIDGCFWHGCPSCYRSPKSNAAYWRTKVELNQERDRRQSRALARAEWTIIRFWTHEPVARVVARTMSELGR